MATISKLCVMLALNDPAPQWLSQEKIAAHNMQYKPLRSLRSLRSDVPLQAPFVHGFAIFAQTLPSESRRLTKSLCDLSMNYSETMNRLAAINELDELREHVGSVISEIEMGKYDPDGELSYQVALAHLMDHLARAWHFSKLTDDEINSLGQDGFERATYSIPKLNGWEKLVDAHKIAHNRSKLFQQ